MCTSQNYCTTSFQIVYKSRVPTTLVSSRLEEDWSIQSKREQDKFQDQVVYYENLITFQTLASEIHELKTQIISFKACWYLDEALSIDSGESRARTDSQTHTQSKYCSPPVLALRVNSHVL